MFVDWFRSNFSNIPLAGADAVLRLTAEGCTIPFIARYRKEQTGGLDEVEIETIIKAKNLWDEIEKRKAFIIGEIEAQNKLTPELRHSIEKCFELNTLEDIYLPYKRKRKTKAAVARDAGLEPLADWLWQVGHGLTTDITAETKASDFINTEMNINDTKGALDGAQAIIVERLTELMELRQLVRESLLKEGAITSEKGKNPKPNSKFENYFEFTENISSLLKPENSHRYLALRRGEEEGELTLTITGSTPDLMDRLQARYESEACTARDSTAAKILLNAARLSFKYYVLSTISAEIHTKLKQVADEAAIAVFAENVRKVLLAAPFGSKTVLGVDPGIRTGCKLALVDQTGKYIASGVIHIENDGMQTQAKGLIKNLIEKSALRAIAIGNGTGSREAETFIRKVLTELKQNIPVVVISEAGASIYSASEVARQEFPDLDLTVRGAISIARRLQDPLAELVKVDPKSIGVGQYQHDVSQSALKQGLTRVVESAVNSVGVNLNTASEHLLTYVSGIGPSLAKSIVEYRTNVGLFKSRQDLLSVPRFSGKAFEQAAGFLRIPESENPLDNTGVHPERYEALRITAERLNKTVSDLIGVGAALLKKDSIFKNDLGEFTSADIIKELEKPGRDPRETFVAFSFREDIHELSDLKIGMSCPGIVTNVANFGAFVDIGVHQDGLVHVSQLSDNFVKDPRTVVNPGDRVTVRVVNVDTDKRQIALSMKKESNDGSNYTLTKQLQKPKKRTPPQGTFKNTPLAGLSDLLKR
ncbi:MAG: Tex family protein [Bdellovibrionota bacterium]|jgi:uncharacterized protein